NLAEAMRQTSAAPVRPSTSEAVRTWLDRRNAYAACARLFEWLAQGGAPAAARRWCAEPTRGSDTPDSPRSMEEVLTIVEQDECSHAHQQTEPPLVAGGTGAISRDQHDEIKEDGEHADYYRGAEGFMDVFWRDGSVFRKCFESLDLESV